MGKAICRLRVVDRNRSVIGIPRSALRAAIYIVLPSCLIWIYWIASGLHPDGMSKSGNMWNLMMVSYTYYALLALLFSTARRRNGYAGLHDLAAGAQVIRRPVYVARPQLEVAVAELPDTADKATIGPYHVLDRLASTDSGEFILGYDSRLLRRVWIHKLPAGAPPVSQRQRNMGRVGRLRWLNGRRDGEECWDAYEALSGKALFELIQEPQPWSVVRYWLLDLAGELSAAEQDGTLPEVFALDRIWITAEGRAKLLDFAAPRTGSAPGTGPAPGTGASGRVDVATLDGSSETASQQLLLQVAASALEGRVIDGEQESLGIAATRLPVDAQSLLRRLPTTELGEICDQMKRLVKRTSKVTRPRRVAMLAATTALPLLFSAFMALGMLMLIQFKQQQPVINELINCMTFLESSDKKAARAENQQDRDKIEAQRKAMEIYIAGSYRSFVSEPANGDNFYARIYFPQPIRTKAEQIVARLEPSPLELKQAKTVIQPILEDYAKQDRVITQMLPTMDLFMVAIFWLLFVTIPGLAAALICRRGMIMRVFGVDCVTRGGVPASRLRMFWRCIVFNAPLILAPILMAFMYPLVKDSTTTILPIIALVLAVACWSCLLPQRGLADRLSGTYPVPN